MADLVGKLKNHYKFSKDEIKSLIIASALIGFTFAFRDFSLTNLIYAIIVAAIGITFHVAIQKVISLHVGYTADFKLWWYGLLAGLAVTFASNGKIWWLVFPGGLTFSIIARHRLGEFRYGLNYMQMGIIAFSGTVASILLGTIFKNIEIYIIGSQIPFLHNIFIFNLVLAIATLLPIPPLNGHYLFFASRMWYAFLFGTVFAYGVLTLVFEIYSWIWAIVMGVIIWLIYFTQIERGKGLW